MIFSHLSILAFLISSIQAAVQINEFHYDNVNRDVNQFIEFRHTEPLTGFEVILYNGFNGLVYNRTDLSNVPVTTTVPRFQYTVLPYTKIANTVGGIVLTSPNGTVLEFISFEGQFTAKNGPAKGMTSIDIRVSESNSCTGAGLSLQKCTNFNSGMWIGPHRATPGKLNRNCTASNFPKNGEPASPCGTLRNPPPVNTPVVTPVSSPIVILTNASEPTSTTTSP